MSAISLTALQTLRMAHIAHAGIGSWGGHFIFSGTGKRVQHWDSLYTVHCLCAPCEYVFISSPTVGCYTYRACHSRPPQHTHTQTHTRSTTILFFSSPHYSLYLYIKLNYGLKCLSCLVFLLFLFLIPVKCSQSQNSILCVSSLSNIWQKFHTPLWQTANAK